MNAEIRSRVERRRFLFTAAVASRADRPLLLAEGLVEEIRARAGLPMWRRESEERPLARRITHRRLKEIQVDDHEEATAESETEAVTPATKHLIPDPEAAAQRWPQKHGGIPINHMVVVRSELSKSEPGVVAEVFRLLRESKSAVAPPKNPEPLRFEES